LLYVILDIERNGRSIASTAGARLRAGFLLRDSQQGEILGMPQTAATLSHIGGGNGADLMTNSEKRKRLEKAGWTAGDAADFLELSPEEARFVELKLALAAGVRQYREKRGWTQAALARQLGSSQSRVAKMEAADGSVTLDLMMRSLLAMGVAPGEIAKLIRKVEIHKAA
jgi:DNA-binding XRE family transcriptional regulator